MSSPPLSFPAHPSLGSSAQLRDELFPRPVPLSTLLSDLPGQLSGLPIRSSSFFSPSRTKLLEWSFGSTHRIKLTFLLKILKWVTDFLPQ